ncbi:MAG: DNA repair protein RecO [Caldilineaceae bacterium]|nr:DNA repair protein RecO [Caldilineaceae bacterium]
MSLSVCYALFTAMANRIRSTGTRAVILRRRDYGDADRIVTAYTPSLGKQEFIAKGIRKTSSRKAGHLELFTHSALQVADARTWPIITEATTIESFRTLRTNLATIGAANYIAELIDRFTEADDENQPLWELLLLALRELDQAADDDAAPRRALLLRWFELHLLGLTGFQPQLFHCLSCGEALEPVQNFLSLSDGGLYCPACATGNRDLEALDPDVLKVLRYLQREPWPAVYQLSVRPAIMLRMENLLHRYLLTILEYRLRSTDFLHHVQG